MKRQRIKLNAVCSSENYRESKKINLHIQEKMQTKHTHKVKETTISYKTIKVFGKEIKITITEYYEHCQGF